MSWETGASCCTRRLAAGLMPHGRWRLARALQSAPAWMPRRWPAMMELCCACQKVRRSRMRRFSPSTRMRLKISSPSKSVAQRFSPRGFVNALPGHCCFLGAIRESARRCGSSASAPSSFWMSHGNIHHFPSFWKQCASASKMSTMCRAWWKSSARLRTAKCVSRRSPRSSLRLSRPRCCLTTPAHLCTRAIARWQKSVRQPLPLTRHCWPSYWARWSCVSF